VAEINDRGKDLRLFTKELTTYLRGILIERMEGRTAGTIGDETLYHLLQILIQAEQEMKWSSQPTLVLELALVKASRPEVAGSLESLARRVAELEQRLAGGLVGTMPATRPHLPEEVKPVVPKEGLEPKEQVEPAKTSGPAPELPPRDGNYEQKTDSAGEETIRQAWPVLLNGIKEGKKMPLWSILKDGQPPLEVNGNTLMFYFENPFDFKTVDKPEYRKYLEWLMGKHFGGQWEVRCVQGKKPAARTALNPRDDPIYTEAVRIFGQELVTLEDDPEGL